MKLRRDRTVCLELLGQVVLSIAEAVIYCLAILDEIEIYWYLVWELLDGDGARPLSYLRIRWAPLPEISLLAAASPSRARLRGSAPRNDAPKDHTQNRGEADSG